MLKKAEIQVGRLYNNATAGAGSVPDYKLSFFLPSFIAEIVYWLLAFLVRLQVVC